ncbi:MAG: GTPase HflX [Alphaproteobacteria bacterium]|nr:GTPase HflX [Alphaproteobacteria bacterium]MDY4690255.1 GTPase HflX [Alphaproteobacteria bacterium]
MIEVQQNRRFNAAVVCPEVFGVPASLSPESRLSEAEGLALAIKLNVVYKESLKIKEIKPSAYFSKGFLERLTPIITEKNVDLLIVDARLSPIQQRNLERELKLKVIDRTALILEIFGERAQTREGALQVELAHLTYQRSRLVRSWTHLERQRGGAGFLGGPGETQIELDRRIIDDKIVRIKKDLEKVKLTRGIQRSARRKVPYPIVALVGYTNAGKSTLFNYLSGSSVMAANMLFATLDPTMRKISLNGGREIILSDTVGFISDLPHELVMAFRATLEEVLNADIILHIRDVSNPDSQAQCADVLDVLAHLGLKEIKNADNYIEVFNKADLLPPEDLSRWQTKTANSSNKVLTSAISGEGCGRLLELIKQKLACGQKKCRIKLPIENGRLQSWLYQNSDILKLENKEDKNIYTICISPENLARFEKMAETCSDIEIRRNL